MHSGRFLFFFFFLSFLARGGQIEGPVVSSQSPHLAALHHLVFSFPRLVRDAGDRTTPRRDPWHSKSSSLHKAFIDASNENGTATEVSSEGGEVTL